MVMFNCLFSIISHVICHHSTPQIPCHDDHNPQEGAKKRRFYGYTVSNICYMLEKKSTTPDGASDAVGRTEMTCRLRKILCALEKYGYDIKVQSLDI